MLHLEDSARSRTRVNVLKKVKVNGHWKLCPAIVEPNGKLKDKVQVNGHAEVHGEGIYYIEWREDSQRRRKAVPNRHEVLEHARLKALELEAKKAGIAIDRRPPPALVPAVRTSSGVTANPIELNKSSSAAGVMLRGVESYLQELTSATVRSQLAMLGVEPARALAESPVALSSAPHGSGPRGDTAAGS